MNTLGRIAIGVGTLSGIGGAGFALHRQLSTESISKKLIANKYQILDSTKFDSDWTAILTSYRAVVSGNNGNDWKFDDFAGAESQEQKLKEKCKNVLSKPSTNDADYKKAARWCVVPKTILELLPKGKYTQLSTNENDDNVNQTDWNKKIVEHNKQNQNQGKRFTNLEGVTGNTIQENTAGRTAIKKKCKGLESKKHHEQSFDSDLEKAKLWCYIEKTE